ncbi:MAG: hypothetical protein JFR39_03465 [Muribaculaceae bacterium]|jgi:hypothetical protein|nr:hypothetical protein [Muribaculaceae bacterium]
MKNHIRIVRLLTILVSVGAIACMPKMLSGMQPDSPFKTFVWLFPLYIAGSGVCAWLCAKGRIEISYILLVLAILSTVLLGYAVTLP